MTYEFDLSETPTTRAANGLVASPNYFALLSDVKVATRVIQSTVFLGTHSIPTQLSL